MGLPSTAKLVETAEEALKEMLGASLVTLAPLSGIHAMMCAILSATKPGDTILTFKTEDGGHFATKGIIEQTGRKCLFLECISNTQTIDLPWYKNQIKIMKPNAIYLDNSYQTTQINLKEIKNISPEVIIIYDASHTLGLILGKQFQNPFKEGADIICANTHKTFPGPQKGIIAFKNKSFGLHCLNIIDSSLYSSVHTHHLIALAISILEIYQYGEEYAKQIIMNANHLAEALTNKGLVVRKDPNLINPYTDTHQIHIYVNNLDEYPKLVENNISTNFDNPIGGKLFIRIGTQEVTRYGMKQNEMIQIASILEKTLKGYNVKNDVTSIVEQFGVIYYSFDNVSKD